MAPGQAPPSRFRGTPHSFRIAAETRLVRIHDAAFGVTEFNPLIARSDLRGGRFDSTAEDPYPFLYAALDERAAVSEALLRDLPFDEHGVRLLPRARLADLRIGWMRTTVDLRLVDLRSGRALAAVNQDTWLTQGPSSGYSMTRQWAAAIRSWAPWCDGLIWRSRREPEGFAVVLFGDRMQRGAIQSTDDPTPLPVDGRSLASGPGARYLEQILSEYSVALM